MATRRIDPPGNDRNDSVDAPPQNISPNCDEPTGDPSLQEENTLSACLMKILQKGDSEENNDLLNVDEKCSMFDSTSSVGLTDDDNSPVMTGTKPKTRQCSSSLQVSDTSSESEVEKLRKWREAGVALRKALSEQSSDSLARTPSSLSGSFRAGSDDPMNLMLDDYMSGPFGPVLGDTCNTVPDIANTNETSTSNRKSSEHKKHNKVLANSTKPVSSHSKKHSRHPTKGNDSTDISQGLAEVREKIKKITSRISINNTPPLKSQASKPSRCTSRSHRLSSKTESSSSETGDEIVPKRHKYVHKAHRTRSNSRSPKTNNTPPGSFREKSSTNSQLSSKLYRGVKTCSTCGGLVQSCDEKEKQGYNPKALNIPRLPKSNKDSEPFDGNQCSKPLSTVNSQKAKSDSFEVSPNRKNELINTLGSLESDEELPNLVTSSEDETSQRGLEEALRNIRKECSGDKEKNNEGLPHMTASEEEQEDEIASKLRCLVSKVIYNS